MGRESQLWFSQGHKRLKALGCVVCLDAEKSL